MNHIDSISNIPLFWIIALVCIIVLMIVGLLAIILLFKLSSKMDDLNNKVGFINDDVGQLQHMSKHKLVKQLDSTTQSFETTTKDLSKSLNAHQQALVSHEQVVKQLPTLVSERVTIGIVTEVQTGLTPLVTKISHLTDDTCGALNKLTDLLSHDHEQFIIALNTLNTDGELTEWVGEFQKAVEPLQTTTNALEQHYATSQDLLKTTGEVVIQLAGVRETTESALSRITIAVERLEADETKYLRDIEHRILARLEEVADTNNRVAEGLSKLETSVTKLDDSNETLSQSVQQVVNTMGELQQLSQQIETQHLNLLKAQKAFQEDMHNRQTGMQSQNETFQAQIQAILSKFEKALEQLSKQADASLKSLYGMNKAHNDMLKQFRQQYQQSLQKQQALLEQHSELFNQTQGLLYNLPTQRKQIVMLGMFVLHLVLHLGLIGILIYGIFQLQ